LLHRFLRVKNTGTIHIDKKEAEKLYGIESRMIKMEGIDDYHSAIYRTEKFFIHLLIKDKTVVGKGYIDTFENINYFEYENLRDANFKNFNIQTIMYGIRDDTTWLINFSRTQAILMKHERLKVYGNSLRGSFPLKSVWFFTDKRLIDRFMRKGKRLSRKHLNKVNTLNKETDHLLGYLEDLERKRFE